MIDCAFGIVYYTFDTRPVNPLHGGVWLSRRRRIRMTGPMKKRVAVCALGGTIAMARTDSSPSVRPAVGPAGLVAAAPQIVQEFDLDIVRAHLTPGASLDWPDLGRAHDDLVSSIGTGSVGAVITQGTDTIEETAFLLDLVWHRAEPLVITGAMRSSDALSPDGPANLRDAVATAGSMAARSRGVLVVMNGEVHTARAVAKTHTASVAAFGSRDVGPVGVIHEGVPRFLWGVPRAVPFARAKLPGNDAPRVAIVQAAFAADAELLCHALATHDGVIIETLGAGHVPSWWIEPIEAAAKRIPVVFATTVSGGSVFTSTYAFAGSEMDLIRCGVLPAGSLSANKARIALTLCLYGSRDRSVIERRFNEFAYGDEPG